MLPNLGKLNISLVALEIEMGDFTSILSIDVQHCIAVVEPFVTMMQLIEKLNTLNLTLPVIPCLTNVPILDIISGYSCGSSSFNQGNFFESVVKSMLVVLPWGEKAIISLSQNSALFKAFPNSLRTLNIVVLSVELACIKLPSDSFSKIESYVKLDYYTFNDLQEMVTRSQQLIEKRPNGPDYLEIFVFKRSSGVIVAGQHEKSLPFNIYPTKINRYWHPWFVTRSENMWKHGDCSEWVLYQDYIRRHDRSLMWEIRDLLPFGSHPLFMPLYGWLIPRSRSREIFNFLSESKSDDNSTFIKQNLLIPLKHIEAFLDLCDEELRLYPLWLCPVLEKVSDVAGSNQKLHHNNNSMMINVGIYGRWKSHKDDQPVSWRRVEQFMHQVGGKMAIQSVKYSFTYLSREEFLACYGNQISFYENARLQLQLSEFNLHDLIGIINNNE